MRMIELGPPLALLLGTLSVQACGEGDLAPQPENAFVGRARGAAPNAVGGSARSAPRTVTDEFDAGPTPLLPDPLDVPQPIPGPTGTGFSPGAGGFGDSGGGIDIGATNGGSDNGPFLPGGGASDDAITVGTNTSGVTTGGVAGTNTGVSGGFNTGVSDGVSTGATTGGVNVDTTGGFNPGGARCELPPPPFGVIVRAVYGDCSRAAYLVDPAVPVPGVSGFVPAAGNRADICLVTATRIRNQGCLLEQRVRCTSGREQASRCVVNAPGQVTCITQLRDTSGTCSIEATFASVR